MTEDERQALMDRNLAAARARVEAADDADRATEATEAVRGGVPWISITSMAEAIEARETIATLHSVCETYEADIRSLHSQLATVTLERDEREAARAEADRIACKVFAEQGDLRAQLADAMQERDELRTILALAAQAVNNLAHGTWGSK